MEEKPKRRLLAKSTGQADLTGVKRPHRLAFCTSQQREVFSMQRDGSETIQEKMQPALKTLRELTEQHQGDPESLLFLSGDLEARHREIQDGAISGKPSRRPPKAVRSAQNDGTQRRLALYPATATAHVHHLLEQGPADMTA